MLWILAILIAVWWYLIVLICSSLMTCDIEHLFIHLLAICIFSLVRCLSCKVFGPFLIRSVVFLLLRFKDSLYILGNGPILHVGFCKYCLTVYGFSSHSLECDLMKPAYELLLSGLCLWCCIYKVISMSKVVQVFS